MVSSTRGKRKGSKMTLYSLSRPFRVVIRATRLKAKGQVPGQRTKGPNAKAKGPKGQKPKGQGQRAKSPKVKAKGPKAQRPRPKGPRPKGQRNQGPKAKAKGPKAQTPRPKGPGPKSKAKGAKPMPQGPQERPRPVVSTTAHKALREVALGM
ncbi:pollen-specific leucine-rich repeat extensin-like protein 1 [Solanum stenotomum]|uniref:pollen-specific leucine-rich repeat extensin-like protein 1 n=1 Tax=Solanum stenotomum TaxID=172797 RepID=UPI0020D1BB18|nr:pollen-specific leucine-rich repeat extensin-like protein 1 [Solanum stenotomum]